MDRRRRRALYDVKIVDEKGKIVEVREIYGVYDWEKMEEVQGMKRASLTVAILISVAVTVMAGGGQESSEDGLTYIIVNNMATWSHFAPDYEGARLAAREISELTGVPINIEIVGPAEHDLLRQAEAMEQAIARRPDGFLVVAWDPNVMQAPINKAAAAGIPTICIDADAPDSDRIAYVGTDWYTLGQELARALAEEIDYEGKVAMIGMIGAANMETAYDGFREIMAEYPRIEIIALEDDSAQETRAAEVTRALLQRHPDLAGIAGFDAGSGPGIATALRETGNAGRVKAVANDMNTAMLQAAEEGTIQFILGQKRSFFGYWGVIMMYIHNMTGLTFTSDDERAGVENIPPRLVTGFLRATPDNVDLYWDLFERYAE